MNIDNLGLVIGLLAGIFSTLAFLPQVIKAFKTKQTKSLSLHTFLLYSASLALWVVYGVFINSLPMILANAVTFVLAVLILLMKIKYG